jgi:hypothetical protein
MSGAPVIEAVPASRRCDAGHSIHSPNVSLAEPDTMERRTDPMAKSRTQPRMTPRDRLAGKALLGFEVRSAAPATAGATGATSRPTAKVGSTKTGSTKAGQVKVGAVKVGSVKPGLVKPG